MKIEINGKEYEINMDLKWGTQKLISKVMNDPTNSENEKYMTAVFRDILIPPPTPKEMFNFRMSDINRIFQSFEKGINETNTDFKKKLSD